MNSISIPTRIYIVILEFPFTREFMHCIVTSEY